MTSSLLPVTALTVLGILVALLGLLAAGSIELIALGLASILAAGILAVVGERRAS